MGRKRNDDEAVDTPDAAPSPEADAPEEATSELEAERDEWKERYQRALADAENARKRHQRETAETRQYAISELARELLGVIDNLERALDGVPEDRAGDPLVTGVRLVADQLQATLGNHGVVPIDALEQPFDPMLHEAIQQEERDDVPPGTVIEELMRGYRVADRLLRASVVRVSKAATANTEGEGGARPKNDEDALGEE